jgi:hypothetical protein
MFADTPVTPTKLPETGSVESVTDFLHTKGVEKFTRSPTYEEAKKSLNVDPGNGGDLLVSGRDVALTPAELAQIGGTTTGRTSAPEPQVSAAPKRTRRIESKPQSTTEKPKSEVISFTIGIPGGDGPTIIEMQSPGTTCMTLDELKKLHVQLGRVIKMVTDAEFPT